MTGRGPHPEDEVRLESPGGATATGAGLDSAEAESFAGALSTGRAPGSEVRGILSSLLGYLHMSRPKMINTPGAVVLGMVYDFLPFIVDILHHDKLFITKDAITRIEEVFA